MSQEAKEHWFAKKKDGLGFKPLNWQGKLTITLYVVLVLLAFIVYSNIGLILLVLFFYTLVFLFILMMKSDLMKDKFPPQE